MAAEGENAALSRDDIRELVKTSMREVVPELIENLRRPSQGNDGRATPGGKL